MTQPTMPRLSIRIVAAVLFALAIGAFYWFFVTTEVGQRVDASTLGATAWYRDKLAGLENPLRQALPLVAVALALVALLGAAWRRRWRDVAWAAALPIVGYGLAAVLRNYVLWRPVLGDYGYENNTLPTGRVVATVACLVVAVWLAPSRWWRSPLILAAAVLAGAVGALQVITFAHRYADIVVSGLLVGLLASLWPMARQAIPLWSLIAWVAVGVGTTAYGTWLVLWWDMQGYAGETQVGACFGILIAMAGSAALALVAGTVMRRR